MNYLEYIKDFDNLAEANETVYEFRKIFNSDIDKFIEYYNDNNFSMIDEDLEENSVSETSTFKSPNNNFSSFLRLLSCDIVSPAKVDQGRNSLGDLSNISSPDYSDTTFLNRAQTLQSEEKQIIFDFPPKRVSTR